MPTNSNNLRGNVDKLDFSVDLTKLSNVVKNGVVEKDAYNAKIENIEVKIRHINLATKFALSAEINDVKGGISSINNLAKTTALNAKINQVKGTVLNITKLTGVTALTAVENKIPNVSNLKKNYYNSRIY